MAIVLDPTQLHKISYFMDSEHETLGHVSEYHVFLSDRLVVRALVQTETDQRVGGDHPNCAPIWVTDHVGENAVRLDEGHAKIKWDETLDKERVSSDSVKYVIMSLIPWILTELYVPKN